MNSGWYERALAASSVMFLNEGDAFFHASLDGWGNQIISSGCSPAYADGQRSQVVRFAQFCKELPWTWTIADLNSYTSYRRSKSKEGKAVTHSTMTAIHGAIRRYCEYLLSPGNGWAELSLERFGSVPGQVCFDFNTFRRGSGADSEPDRRLMTHDELDTFFAASIDWVAAKDRSGRKGWLPAMRDVTLFKCAWAFGLRRNELRMLDLADLQYSTGNIGWGRFGKLQVRSGKAANGGAPKRRTVLLLHQYQPVLAELSRWVTELRPQMQAPPSVEAIFVSERQTRVSLRTLDKRFAELRDFARLPPQLTMHSLRRSYITHAQEFGYPLFFVQAQAGHAHAATTGGYTHHTDEYRSKVVTKALAGYWR